MPGTYNFYYTQVDAPDWPHRAIYFTATREPSSPALPAFSSCGEWIFPTFAPDVPQAASAWAAQVLLRHARLAAYLCLRVPLPAATARCAPPVTIAATPPPILLLAHNIRNPKSQEPRPPACARRALPASTARRSTCSPLHRPTQQPAESCFKVQLKTSFTACLRRIT